MNINRYANNCCEDHTISLRQTVSLVDVANAVSGWPSPQMVTFWHPALFRYCNAEQWGAVDGSTMSGVVMCSRVRGARVVVVRVDEVVVL